MSRPRLIRAAAEQFHEGRWQDILVHSMEYSGTWLPWVVLCDNGNVADFQWVPSGRDAHAVCVSLRGTAYDAMVVQVGRMIGHEAIRISDDICAHLDWSIPLGWDDQ